MKRSPYDQLLHALDVRRKAMSLSTASNSHLRLLFGELTVQEIRTLKATLNYILNAKENPQETSDQTPPR